MASIKHRRRCIVQQRAEIEGDVRACVRACVRGTSVPWLLMQGLSLGVFCPDNLRLLPFDPAKLR